MKTTGSTRREFLAAAGSTVLANLSMPPVFGSAVASEYRAKVLAKKPAGYWRLDEARGVKALDSTENGHHGVYKGSPVLQERGALKGDADTAVRLDGNRSYVEIPNHKDFSQPTSGKGLTVEVWLRPDVLDFKGATDDPYIYWLGKSEPGKHEWALRFYSRKSKDRPNRISAYLFNPAGGLGAGAFFQDRLTVGEWLHVVACYEAGDAKSANRPGVHIFKNGEHRQGPPAPGTLYDNPKWQIKSAHGNAPVRLGTCDSKSFLKGGLDEVAIYPRVLTAQEIVENYRAGVQR